MRGRGSKRVSGFAGAGLIAGAVLAAITLASPARAAERELDEEPAPGSAEDIKTPMERTFPTVDERPPLIPGLKERLEDYPPFFADTRLDVRLRTFYRHNDRTDDTVGHAWATGGSVAYRSGWLADTFALEVEGFTSHKTLGNERRGGTGLLNPVQQGYSVLGIANAKLRYKGMVLTGYRQYLDLPYMNKQDNRMTPNTFDGITLAKPEGALRWSTGWARRVKLRNSNDFESFTKVRGFDKNRGLLHGGALWTPNENFYVGAIAAMVPDLLGGLYLESGGGVYVADEVNLRLDTQFTYQWDPGDDLSGSEVDDSWNLGIRGSASYAGAVARLGAAFTGPSGTIVSFYGTHPSYVDLMQRTFTREEEKAFLGSLSYDFAGVGFPGLTAIMNVVVAFDGKPSNRRNSDAQEVDLTIDYKIEGGWLNSFWLRVRGSWVHEQHTDSNGTDLRIILRYDFAGI